MLCCSLDSTKETSYVRDGAPVQTSELCNVFATFARGSCCFIECFDLTGPRDRYSYKIVPVRFRVYNRYDRVTSTFNTSSFTDVRTNPSSLRPLANLFAEIAHPEEMKDSHDSCHGSSCDESGMTAKLIMPAVGDLGLDVGGRGCGQPKTDFLFEICKPRLIFHQFCVSHYDHSFACHGSLINPPVVVNLSCRNDVTGARGLGTQAFTVPSFHSAIHPKKLLSPSSLT